MYELKTFCILGFIRVLFHRKIGKGLESIRGFFGLRFSENLKFHILCSLHSYHKGNMPK